MQSPVIAVSMAFTSREHRGRQVRPGVREGAVSLGCLRAGEGLCRHADHVRKF